MASAFTEFDGVVAEERIGEASDEDEPSEAMDIESPEAVSVRTGVDENKVTRNNRVIGGVLLVPALAFFGAGKLSSAKLHKHCV